MAKASRAKRPTTEPLQDITMEQTPIIQEHHGEPEIEGIVINMDDIIPPVQEKPVEELPNLPATVLFDASLVKFDINQEQINKYKELVPTLKIESAEDKKGYELVYETRQELKRARTTLEKKRKELVAPHNKYVTAVNDKANEYKDQLEPLEAQLQEKEKWFEAEQERINKEREEKEATRVADRTAILIDNGAAFDGMSFAKGTFALSVGDIRTMDDEDFNRIANEIKTIHEQELAEEQRKKDKEERERLDLLEAQRKLKEQEEELQKQLEEAKEREIKFRVYQLEQSGFTKKGIHWMFENTQGSTGLFRADVETLSAAEWQSRFADMLAEKSTLIAREEKEQQRIKDEQEAVNRKVAMLETRGMQLNNLGYNYLNEDEASYWFKHDEGKEYSIAKVIYNDESDVTWTKIILDLKLTTRDFLKEKEANALKAEKRRGDLKGLGLTLEKILTITWGDTECFVYRGKHIIHPFIPNDETTLVKRDDEYWNTKTLPGVKSKVAALKEADEQEITKRLNEETQRKDLAKTDVEKLQELNAKLYSFQSRELPNVVLEPATHAIHIVHGKLEDAIAYVEKTIKDLS